MAYEKVVALYDTDGSARAAIKTLRSAGYSADDISLIQSEGEAERAGLHEPGIWQRLFGKDLEHHEAAVLSRSLREGSAIVAVRVHESEAPRVINLLDSHKPVDVLDRARTYGLMGAGEAIRTEPVKTTATTPTRLTDEQVMRLAEEQLNVGKRVVDAGYARVRRFVIERPVEANVTLHEEHVEIMRRAVSDPGYAKDIDWTDKTFEVAETAEEAVVDKSARIAEEVVIRKTGSDRVKTVHDTVRKQQVDVERVPVGAGPAKK